MPPTNYEKAWADTPNKFATFLQHRPHAQEVLTHITFSQVVKHRQSGEILSSWFTRQNITPYYQPYRILCQATEDLFGKMKTFGHLSTNLLSPINFSIFNGDRFRALGSFDSHSKYLYEGDIRLKVTSFYEGEVPRWAFQREELSLKNLPKLLPLVPADDPADVPADLPAGVQAGSPTVAVRLEAARARLEEYDGKCEQRFIFWIGPKINYFSHNESEAWHQEAAKQQQH